MTTFATVIAGFLAVIIETSVLPWAPLFAAVSVTGMGASVLVVTGRMRTAALLVIAAGFTFAYLGGAPTFSRALIMAVAILALVPVRELLRSGHAVTTVVIVSIILGIAARGTFTLTVSVIAAVGVAAFENAIVAGVWLALRRTPRMQLFR